MKRYINITIIGLIAFTTGLQAQRKHEFSFYGGGGLSTLNYSVTAGNQKNGFGGQIGAGYHFFFSQNWGLGTGVELSRYNAKYNLNNLHNRYMTADKDGDLFEFRNTISHYKETQSASALQIPLMLQYQTNGKRQYYAAIGGKVGFPLNEKFKSSGAAVVNSGYYEYENYEYTTQQFLGFGTFEGKGANGSLDFKTAFFVSAETGVKWKLNEKMSLYSGVYLDYGLNNIKTENASQQFVEYNSASPADFTMNSIVNSQYAQNSASKTFTDKITPIAAGIKLRLAFGVQKSDAKKKVAPYTIPIPQPPAPTPERPASEQPVTTPPAKEQETEPPVEDKQEIIPPVAEIAPQKEAVEQPPQKITQWYVQNYVLSETGLTAKQKQKWDEIIAYLHENSDTKFYINGHTCDIGSNEINERIGLQRAENVKTYLLSKGIAVNRILGVSSKRDAEPLASNTSEENRRINRRVEIRIE